ncbi:unnamed protein product [Euphydryas editha]|uniref:Uncharacterized protein n=1 Tax=Euphydryas editha TaxID=104508 RepID=A0AAU9UUE1_EUPED|nr:unnamed protein product [Euphydryas editha]
MLQLPLVLIAAVLIIISKNHNYNIKRTNNPDFDIRVRRHAKITDDNHLKQSEVLEDLEKTLEIIINSPDGEDIINYINSNYADIDATKIDENNYHNKEVIDESTKRTYASTDFDSTVNKSGNIKTQFSSGIHDAAKKVEDILKSDSNFIVTLENVQNNIINTLKIDALDKDDSSENNLRVKETIDILKTLINENKLNKLLDYIFENFKNTSPLHVDVTTEVTDNEFRKLKDPIKSLENYVNMVNEINKPTENKVIDKSDSKDLKTPDVFRVKGNVSIIDILKKDRSKRDTSKNPIVKFVVNLYHKIYNYTHPQSKEINDKNNNYNYTNDNYQYNNYYNHNNDIEKSQAYQNYLSYNQNNYNNSYAYAYDYNYNNELNNLQNNNYDINNNESVNNDNNNGDNNETTTEIIVQGCITCFSWCPKDHKRIGFVCVRVK